MKLTKHAQQRSQQRGIPPIVMDLLTKFGREEWCGKGMVRYTMDKDTRRYLRSYAGKSVYAAIEPYLDCYTVVSEDADKIITAAHRFKRFKHVN